MKMVSVLSIGAILAILALEIGQAAAETYDAGDRSSRTIVLLRGERLVGTWRGIASPTELQFEVDGATRVIPHQELVVWGGRNLLRTRGRIALTDGSILATNEPPTNQPPTNQPPTNEPPTNQPPTTRIRGKGNAVFCREGICAGSELPRAVIRSIHMRLSPDRSEPDRELPEVDGASVTPGGILELENGDRIPGQWVDVPGGDDQNAVPEAVIWKSRTGRIEVPWGRVRSLRLPNSPAPANEGKYLIGMRDGSLLVVRDMRATGAAIQLTLGCGITIHTEASDFFTDAISLESLAANRLYLSDIEPLSYKHVPFLSRSWPLGRDRSVSGAWMRSQSHVVSKGLGMHSTSRVAYDVSAGFERFEADLGLDESVGELGSVVFRVFVDDGSGTWKPAYESPVVRGRDRPIPISVEIARATRIALIVDSADHADVQDHANWLYARLLRPGGAGDK